MAFIKFTEKTEGPAGPNCRLRFINADQISSAVFNEESGLLQVVLAGDLHRWAFSIEGEDALEALKVLQRL